MSSLEIAACFLLVGISALMSSSEVAIFSLSRFQLRYLKENFRASHRRIRKLLGDPGGLLVAILVINEAVNIALSGLIAGAVSRANQGQTRFGLPAWAAETLLGLLFTAPIVLLFCETTPKIIGARANQLVATLSAGLLTFVYEAAWPIRRALKLVVLITSRWAAKGPKESGADVSTAVGESDFMLMVEEGHREGAVHENELELIKNVFELDDSTVEDVYTPIHQVQTLPVATTVRQALTVMRSNRYSRIPVTGPNRRKIVGMLYSKDLLKAKLDPTQLSHTIDEFMRSPMLVTPQVKLNALFRRFKQQKCHLAIVVPAGSQETALGVVTMNDLLGAIFGDLE